MIYQVKVRVERVLRETPKALLVELNRLHDDYGPDIVEVWIPKSCFHKVNSNLAVLDCNSFGFKVPPAYSWGKV